MKMNFNIGGNKSKVIVTEEIVENDEDLEELTENTSSSNNNDNYEKKRLIRMMGLILGVVIAFIILLFFITSLFGGNKTYEEIEEIMIDAAESYFTDHQENLPKKDGGSQTVDVSVLAAEGYMKDLTKYTDAACTGSVKVVKSGISYLYTPNLNCGEAYLSQELYEKVRQDNSIVASGYGLYNKDGNYVFRGEKVNNYVQLDSALWRIVKITSGNNLVLVMDEPLGTLVPWDDRYNQETSYNAGINNYSSSRIKEKLDELYKTTDEDVIARFLSDKDKAKVVGFNLCTGKRGIQETGTEQAVECREVLKDQKVGLLTAADYMNASIDANCTSPSNASCQNYNYLITDTSWWLVTAAEARSYDTYLVEANNGIKVTNTNMYARLRPVIHLNTNVLYKSGSGTEEDPYIVK